MNIHCSACGAPLPKGGRFCPACALPLTAIAMPTPAPPRKRGIGLLSWCIILFGAFWVVAYASDHYHDDKAAPVAAAPTANASVDHGLEGRVEQDIWFSTGELRSWRKKMAGYLVRDQQRLGDPHDTAAQGDVDFDQAALARINARLHELKAR
jgi:hypothetical protein